MQEKPEMRVQSLGQEDPLKEEMATQSSILAWKIPRKEELQSAAAKSLQSCWTLCDPIDSSPPGSPSLGFSRQEYWSGVPLPSPHEILPDTNMCTCVFCVCPFVT